MAKISSLAVFEERIGDKENFISLYIGQNMTQYEIADMFGVERDTVKTYVKKYCITKPRKMQAEKRRETNLRIYGVAAPLQNPDIMKKAQETNLKRYGHICSLQNEDVNQKARETMKERYGVEYSGQNPELLKKLHDTLEEKTGYRFATWAGKELRNVEILNSKDKFEEFIKNSGDRTIRGLAAALGYDSTSVEKKIHEYSLEDLYDPYYFTSFQEKEVEDFLTKNGIKLRKNKKDLWPREIDLYDDRSRTGVEYNGCFFHNVEKKGVVYHQEKSIEARKRGIFIYHLYEFEWIGEISRLRIENDLCDVFDLLPVCGGQCKIEESNKEEFVSFVTDNFGEVRKIGSDSFWKVILEDDTVACFRGTFDGNFTIDEIFVKLGVSSQNIKKAALDFVVSEWGSICDIFYNSSLDKEKTEFLEDRGFELLEIISPRKIYGSHYRGLHAFDDEVTEEEKEYYKSKSYFEEIYNAGGLKWIRRAKS